jgi:hypothetical protein
MKQTSLEFLEEKLQGHLDISRRYWNELLAEAKEMDKCHKILLVEQLKEYTKEAQCILGNDEREASEFVDIFHQTNFKYKEQFKKK